MGGACFHDLIAQKPLIETPDRNHMTSSRINTTERAPRTGHGRGMFPLATDAGMVNMVSRA